jgi:hypothetical protein
MRVWLNHFFRNKHMLLLLLLLLLLLYAVKMVRKAYEPIGMTKLYFEQPA